MASDLSFVCDCGAVSGTLIDGGPDQGDHVICHCTDCQDLARHLGHAGRVLDAHGGCWSPSVISARRRTILRMLDDISMAA